MVELKLILEADKQRLLQARNQALPSLNAVASYQWNGLSGEMPNGEELETRAGQYTNWTVGVKRVFNGKPASQLHTGTDYPTPVGTPILAVADGVVDWASRRRSADDDAKPIGLLAYVLVISALLTSALRRRHHRVELTGAVA